MSNRSPEYLTHVHRQKYLSKVLKKNPSELLRLVWIAFSTAKYRLLGCVGKGTVVGTHTEIINTANVSIGRDALLQDHIYIRAGTQGYIRMGDRVAINSFVRLFGHGGIEIEDDAQLGPGTLITTTDHDIFGKLEADFKQVHIGKRAWIGANVTILPGVCIGEYAVIGAGAVVTRDIPARCIAVGVPARVIRSLDGEVIPVRTETLVGV